jgi:hypothetical protein
MRVGKDVMGCDGIVRKISVRSIDVNITDNKRGSATCQASTQNTHDQESSKKI